jgi:hypothetical protein
MSIILTIPNVLRYPIINKFIISYAVTVAYMGTGVRSGTDGLGSAFVCVDASVCAHFVHYGRKGCAVGEASYTTVTLIIVGHIIVADTTDIDVVMTVVDVVVVIDVVMTVVDVVVVVDVTIVVVVVVAGVFGDVTFGAYSIVLS